MMAEMVDHKPDFVYSGNFSTTSARYRYWLSSLSRGIYRIALICSGRIIAGMSTLEPPQGGKDLPADPSGQIPAWPPQKDLYDKHAGQAWTDQQASSDEFDKSLLTFSSGALGLSLSFIKDIVPLDKAGFLCWLFVSWASFTFCIVATMASFPFSIQAQKSHLDYLYKYYVEGRPEFFNKQSGWSVAVTVCAVLGGLFFLIGLVATVVFAIANISKGVHK